MCWFTNAKIKPFEDQPNGMRPNSQLSFIRLNTYETCFLLNNSESQQKEIILRPYLHLKTFSCLLFIHFNFLQTTQW